MREAERREQAALEYAQSCRRKKTTIRKKF